MKIVRHEQIIAFDIDDTLVFYEPESVTEKSALKPVMITDPYDESLIKAYAHNSHIKLLKDKKARGAYILVWSQSGYRWAEAVIMALGLQSYVDQVMSKPTAYVDDLPCNEWMGARIYLSGKSHYKGS